MAAVVTPGIIDDDDDDENGVGPFLPFNFPVCVDGDGICREREFDVRMVATAVAVGPVCVRCDVRCVDVDRERPRFDFGEHTEHESSVQLTELFDGDLVACIP